LKIIDEKGRLFGKINIIDFIVVVFLINLLPMVYFGYKIFTRSPVKTTKDKEFVQLEFECRFIKLSPDRLQLISVGDKEFDREGNILGEIINLGRISSYTYQLDIGNMQQISKEDKFLKEIAAKISVQAEVKGSNIYYQGQTVTTGTPFEFTTNKYTLLVDPDFHRKELTLREKLIDFYVILKDLDKDLLEKISVGNKELDEKGMLVAEILEIGSIRNSSVDIKLGENNFVSGELSDKKQISAKMRLRCQISDEDNIYFKNKTIKEDDPISFQSEEYSAKFILTKVFEIIPSIDKKWLSLQVKFDNIIPEITRLIQKGDVEKNVKDDVVATVDSIISVNPTPAFHLKDNDFLEINHPFNKEMLLSLNVQCAEKKGTFYFKNYPVKMGNNIAFSTDLYSVTGTIIGMEFK